MPAHRRLATQFSPLVLGLLVFVTGGEGLSPPEAKAIPAFARRYEFSCNNCHHNHYPRLNSFGRRFRENGLQLPDGAEDPFRARRNVEPGTLAEALSIFKEIGALPEVEQTRRNLEELDCG